MFLFRNTPPKSCAFAIVGRSIVGQNRVVKKLSLLADGRVVSVSDPDNMLQIWNIVGEDATCVGTFIGGKDANVQSFSSFQQDWLAVSYEDKKMNIFHLPVLGRYQFKGTLNESTSISITALIAFEDHVISGHSDGTIRIWKTIESKLETIFHYHNQNSQFGHISTLSIIEQKYLVAIYGSPKKRQAWELKKIQPDETEQPRTEKAPPNNQENLSFLIFYPHEKLDDSEINEILRLKEVSMKADTSKTSTKKYHGSFPQFPVIVTDSQDIRAGTFAKIKTATLEYNNSQHPVAIKESHFNKRHLVKKEASLHIQLTHENIVHLYGLSDPGNALIMEHMPCDLWTRLDDTKDSRMTVSQRLRIMQGIAAGLMYLHEVGVIHRDLKSENILLDHDGHPKICDFGLSVRSNSSAYSTGVVGTLFFLSPKISAAYVQDRDMRSSEWNSMDDIFALLIVYWEIETNNLRPLYQDRREELKDYPENEMFLQIHNEIAHDNLRERFPDSTDEVIVKMAEQAWDSDETKRPSANEIYTTLTECLKSPFAPRS